MLVLMNLMICESRSCSSIVSGLLSLCDILCQKSVGKNTSQGSYVSTPATPRLTLKNRHTIPYNKIIRNCMELSGILTVQALCVFSCQVWWSAAQSFCSTVPECLCYPATHRKYTPGTTNWMLILKQLHASGLSQAASEIILCDRRDGTKSSTGHTFPSGKITSTRYIHIGMNPVSANIKGWTF